MCGKSVARADYDNHLKNECPKRKETCPYCSLPIEMDSFNEHIVFFFNFRIYVVVVQINVVFVMNILN